MLCWEGNKTGIFTADQIRIKQDSGKILTVVRGGVQVTPKVTELKMAEISRT